MTNEKKPAKRIILFGQQNLQNSVLLGYLQQRTGFECLFAPHPQWREVWNNSNQSTLALIDADIARPDRVLELMEQIYQQPINIRVAFFGVPAHHPVEKMVAWPIVMGIFASDSTQQQLCKGIGALFDGECWLPRQIVADYLHRTRQKPKKVSVCDTVLTKREIQILDLTATGASNVDIAEKLNLSMHTVKTHIYNLFKKIGVSNRIQAVNWAKEHLEAFSERA